MYVDDVHGAGVATLKVERCTARSTPGMWQVTARRLDGRLFDAAVDELGRDRNGYVNRPDPTHPAPASTTRQEGARS
jgi:hypothetical protein